MSTSTSWVCGASGCPATGNDTASQKAHLRSAHPAGEAERPHDYESPRGEMYPTEPCAVCGLSLAAGIHQPKGRS